MILTESYLVGRMIACIDEAEKALTEHQSMKLAESWLALADKWYHLYENLDLASLDELPGEEDDDEGSDDDDDDGDIDWEELEQAGVGDVAETLAPVENAPPIFLLDDGLTEDPDE